MKYRLRITKADIAEATRRRNFLIGTHRWNSFCPVTQCLQRYFLHQHIEVYGADRIIIEYNNTCTASKIADRAIIAFNCGREVKPCRFTLTI